LSGEAAEVSSGVRALRPNDNCSLAHTQGVPKCLPIIVCGRCQGSFVPFSQRQAPKYCDFYNLPREKGRSVGEFILFQKIDRLRAPMKFRQFLKVNFKCTTAKKL
jgi:hypothetical protein